MAKRQQKILESDFPLSLGAEFLGFTCPQRQWLRQLMLLLLADSPSGTAWEIKTTSSPPKGWSNRCLFLPFILLCIWQGVWGSVLVRIINPGGWNKHLQKLRGLVRCTIKCISHLCENQFREYDCWIALLHVVTQMDRPLLGSISFIALCFTSTSNWSKAWGKLFST